MGNSRIFTSKKDEQSDANEDASTIFNRVIQDDDETKIEPIYYKSNNGEVWENMIKVFGKEKFIVFCEINAFKYRMRAGKKTSDYSVDIEKALWYENKIIELTKE